MQLDESGRRSPPPAVRFCDLGAPSLPAGLGMSIKDKMNKVRHYCPTSFHLVPAAFTTRVAAIDLPSLNPTELTIDTPTAGHRPTPRRPRRVQLSTRPKAKFGVLEGAGDTRDNDMSVELGALESEDRLRVQAY